MNPNFDLSALALKAVCPGNEILYDDLGMPSIMVRVPKATYAELGLGDSTATFPAFIVNDVEVPEIYIGKYQAFVRNSRAYSLPGRLPTTSVTLNTAISRCSAKGAGWHLMTKVEHAALMLWCQKNGFMPIGNNDYGKHTSETIYTGIPGSFETDGRRQKILTGTGPLSYYHNNALSGIADLCGNVWEWSGGIRTVYGEVQILANNNAADSSHSQDAASAEWKAINAATGELVTPDGEGTTEGTVKMDFRNNVLTYSTTIETRMTAYKSYTFGSITKDETIGDAALLLLQALSMYPPAAETILAADQICYFHNGEAERAFCCGGRWGSASYGAASFSGSGARSDSGGGVGFRLAYVKLPTA